MTHSTFKCNDHGREHGGSLQRKIILSGVLQHFNCIGSMVLINKMILWSRDRNKFVATEFLASNALVLAFEVKTKQQQQRQQQKTETLLIINVIIVFLI